MTDILYIAAPFAASVIGTIVGAISAAARGCNLQDDIVQDLAERVDELGDCENLGRNLTASIRCAHCKQYIGFPSGYVVQSGDVLCEDCYKEPSRNLHQCQGLPGISLRLDASGDVWVNINSSRDCGMINIGSYCRRSNLATIRDAWAQWQKDQEQETQS